MVGSHLLVIPPSLASTRPGTGRTAITSRPSPDPCGSDYIVPAAPHPAIAGHARADRLLRTEAQVWSRARAPATQSNKRLSRRTHWYSVMEGRSVPFGKAVCSAFDMAHGDVRALHELRWVDCGRRMLAKVYPGYRVTQCHRVPRGKAVCSVFNTAQDHAPGHAKRTASTWHFKNGTTGT